MRTRFGAARPNVLTNRTPATCTWLPKADDIIAPVAFLDERSHLFHSGSHACSPTVAPASRQMPLRRLASHTSAACQDTPHRPRNGGTAEHCYDRVRPDEQRITLCSHGTLKTKPCGFNAANNGPWPHGTAPTSGNRSRASQPNLNAPILIARSSHRRGRRGGLTFRRWSRPRRSPRAASSCRH